MSAAPYEGLFFDPLAPAVPAGAAAPAGSGTTDGAIAGATTTASTAADQQPGRNRHLQEGRAASLLQVQKDLERLFRGRAAS